MAYTGASDMAPNPLSLDVVGRVGEPIRVNKEKAKTGRSILLKASEAIYKNGARDKRRATYFSALKEFFDRSQFFCARPSCFGKPHAQDPARRPNARCDFIEAEIRVFNELSESCDRDQHPFSDLFSFLGSFFKSHKSFSSERSVA